VDCVVVVKAQVVLLVAVEVRAVEVRSFVRINEEEAAVEVQN